MCWSSTGRSSRDQQRSAGKDVRFVLDRLTARRRACFGSAKAQSEGTCGSTDGDARHFDDNDDAQTA